jgi:hypothetical protein
MKLKDSTTSRKSAAITCADCGRDAGVLAHGWHAYYVPEIDLAKAPTLAWYCPDCMTAFKDAVEAIHARARENVNALPAAA